MQKLLRKHYPSYRGDVPDVKNFAVYTARASTPKFSRWDPESGLWVMGDIDAVFGLLGIEGPRGASAFLWDLKYLVDAEGTPWESLDSSWWLLPISHRRVVDLRTGEVRPRRRDDYFTLECPVSDVGQVTPEVEGFFAQFWPDQVQRAKMQVLLGGLLSGVGRPRNPGPQKSVLPFALEMGCDFPILESLVVQLDEVLESERQSLRLPQVAHFYGRASTGKSTVCQILKSVMGDLYVQYNRDVLSGRDQIYPYRRSGKPRVALFQELSPDHPVNYGILNQLHREYHLKVLLTSSASFTVRDAPREDFLVRCDFPVKFPGPSGPNLFRPVPQPDIVAWLLEGSKKYHARRFG